MATPPSPPLDAFRIFTSIVGGVSLLTYALSVMSNALRAALGDRMRGAVKATTAHRLIGLGTGIIVTALLSSATAASMLVLQLVGASDMPLDAALAVLLGVNIGSTLNAHLLAYSLGRYALLLIAVGYAVSSTGRLPPAVRHIGETAFGLGLLLHASAVMGSGIAPLRSHPPFLESMARLSHPVAALLTSAAASVLLSSSNSVIAMAIMMSQSGLLDVRRGIYIVLGANVGE